MQLGLFRHHGEYFPLDGRRPILDAIDHVETEEVQTGVDFVANKGLRLLYEALDLSVLLRDDHTVASGVFHLGHHDRSLLAMASVVLDKLLQWVLANHVRIEDKEEARLIVLTQVRLSELDRTSSAHGLVFQTHRDLDSILSKAHTKHIYINLSRTFSHLPFVRTPRKLPS